MKLHTLKRGPRDNRYCGPAVLSFLTGYSTSQCAAVIRSVTGKRATFGTPVWALTRAAAQFGLRIEEHALRGRKRTLVSMMRDLREDGRLRAGRVYAIVAGNHWQLVTGRRYACGRIGEIVSIRDERVKRRARVTYVGEVVGGPITSPACLVPKRRDTRKATDRAYCKRAQQRGVVSIEIDELGEGLRHIYVWPTAEVQDDPYDGCRISHDWHEARELVETYERLAQEAAT